MRRYKLTPDEIRKKANERPKSTQYADHLIEIDFKKDEKIFLSFEDNPFRREYFENPYSLDPERLIAVDYFKCYTGKGTELDMDLREYTPSLELEERYITGKKVAPGEKGLVYLSTELGPKYDAWKRTAGKCDINIPLEDYFDRKGPEGTGLNKILIGYLKSKGVTLQEELADIWPHLHGDVEKNPNSIMIPNFEEVILLANKDLKEMMAPELDVKNLIEAEPDPVKRKLMERAASAEEALSVLTGKYVPADDDAYARMSPEDKEVADKIRSRQKAKPLPRIDAGQSPVTKGNQTASPEAVSTNSAHPGQFKDMKKTN